MTDTTRLAEVTEAHTRILRLALAIEESRAYWANVDPTVPPQERNLAAFEQRWFGAKTLERVRTLLANMSARYDAYPPALSVLQRWPDVDPQTRQVLCHWHLQLTDPIYRTFTGRFLVARRDSPRPELDRDVVVRWVGLEYPDRWGPATQIQFASKLLSAAYEAGLVGTNKDPRPLALPKVTDVALAYLLYLLREVHIEGTQLDNPYLASVGLTEGFLDQRLRALPGVDFRRMGALTEFHWAAPTLQAWAEAYR